MQYQIAFTSDLLLQSDNYLEVAKERERDRQLKIKAQIEQLEKLEKEREELSRLQRDKELEQDQKIEQLRLEVMKKAQQNVEAIKKGLKGEQNVSMQDGQNGSNADNSADESNAPATSGTVNDEEAYDPTEDIAGDLDVSKKQVEVKMLNSDDENLEVAVNGNSQDENPM